MAAELEQTVACFVDGRTWAEDVGRDAQGGHDIRDRDAADLNGGRIDGLRAAADVNVTGDGGNRGRIARGDRDRRGVGEGEKTAGGDRGGGGAAVVVKGEAAEGVCSREGEHGAAAQGDGIGGVDLALTGRVGDRSDELGDRGVVQREATSRDDHVSRVRAAKFEGALRDRGTTVVGVHAGEGKHTATRLNQGRTRTLDAGVDRHDRGTGGVGVIVHHEFRRAAGDDAAAGDGSDGGGVVVVTAEDAAESEIQNVSIVGEIDIRGEGTADTKKTGGRGARAQEDGGGCGRDDVGDVARGKGARGGGHVGGCNDLSIVAGETTLPDHTDALAGVVCRVIRGVGDGPGTQNTAADGGRSRTIHDAGIVTLLAKIGSGEVDGRACTTRQTGERQIQGGDGAATRVGGDGIGPLQGADRTKGFCGSGAEASGDREGAAAQIDRDRITHAIVDLGLEAGVVAEGESGEIDLDVRGVEQCSIVFQGGGAAHEDGAAGVALGTFKGQCAALDSAEAGATGDDAAEGASVVDDERTATIDGAARAR